MGRGPKVRGLAALGLTGALGLVAQVLGAQPAVLPASVRERLERGDDQGVLTELDALPALRVEQRYLKARVLARLGRLDRALAALPATASDLEQLPGAVRAQLREHRALWLARLGRCAEALPELVALAANGTPEHELRAAECALATGDAAGALARLERTSTRGRWVDAVAVGMTHSEALLALGRRAEAAQLLRRLVVTRPEHMASERVLAALRAAGDGAALTLDERMARAARFMQVRMPARALDELDRLTPPREANARAAYLHARGMALFGMRTRYAEAARVLDQAARLGGADSVDDAFHAARALSRADRDNQAVAAYRRFARAHRGTPRALQAEYLAAWIELRAGMARGARELQRIVDSKGTAPARRTAARFELGMYRLDRKDYVAAEALFTEYARAGDGEMGEGRGLYWAARAAQLGASRSAAEALYRKVLAVEPLHWYALLARERLEQLGVSVPEPFDAASAVAGGAAVPMAAATSEPGAPPRTANAAASRGTGVLALPELATFYAGLGLLDDARDALQASESEVIERAPAARGLDALLRAYHRLGEYARPKLLALRAYPRLVHSAPTAETRPLWQAAFARPHAELVAELERTEQLPNGYLHAIMRKESGFDPHVVSYADAIGLMQLLPATARTVGQRLGLEVSREALFDPELNLRLSARFSATLLRELGEPVLAIAAYNAGEHRVRPWLQREAKRGAVELDRFVERIPIEQTRNYVRRVVTNWARYVSLAAPEPNRWPLRLPLSLRVPRAARAD